MSIKIKSCSRIAKFKIDLKISDIKFVSIRWFIDLNIMANKRSKNLLNTDQFYFKTFCFFQLMTSQDSFDIMLREHYLKAKTVNLLIKVPCFIK